MSADVLLERLAGVRRSGDGKWRARCPVHGSRSGTLAIRQELDGRVLVHCHALCATEDILSRVGLDWGDLFPAKAIDYHIAPVKKPWHVGDVVRALKFELDVAWIVVADLSKGKRIDETDRQRASVACERILRFMLELEHAA
jgi:hypothetical protein